ncbi:MULTISPECIES: hypothetical protein [unclassified Streptomyces]|uniref:hypothetical protein n=1 Tax=unclassified Streptomyces TaxID=2593676 RepID=UPI00224FD533|nr:MULTISPECIES: hypothetical protein [unclassified Streptomyces]MCX4409378.1 hypothetical protein [Streptomyces sp. NBC_01764]MCX5191143.1 hypothetical protein [Streptomyces sp. NBC_00268]
MSIRRRVTALAATTALAGLATLGLTASADAATAAAIPQGAHSVTVHPDGYEPTSRIQRGRCTGWVTTKKISGRWNAQGVLRSNNAHCQMYLARKYGSGSYTPVSNDYLSQAGEDQTWRTGFHRDDRGYKARVCISNIDRGDQKFYCGKGV